MKVSRPQQQSTKTSLQKESVNLRNQLTVP